MKLKGYIKALKENCFAIPIYSDGTNYFYHNLSEDFKILSFEKTEITESYFIKIYLSKIFEVNSIGALIFVGFENYTLYNSADKVIDEVIFFLKDLTKDNEFLNIKKEVFELQKILFENKISETEISNIDIAFEQIVVNEIDDKEMIKYSLEEYMEIKNSTIQFNILSDLRKKDIQKQIENSILDNNLFVKNKEVLLQLFSNYLSDNKSILELLMINTNIGKNFTSYLSTKSESLNPIEMTFEEELKLRVDERRKKLKDFNYQFNFGHLNEKLENEPAYKRYGIDINYIADNVEPNKSKYILFINDNSLSEEINQEVLKNSETVMNEEQKISK